MTAPLVAVPGGWELIVIVLVIVLLFGARKLPELARGTGQALRIFKSETKGLIDDDTDPEERAGELPPGDNTSTTGTTSSAEAAAESEPTTRDN